MFVFVQAVETAPLVYLVGTAQAPQTVFLGVKLVSGFAFLVVSSVIALPSGTVHPSDFVLATTDVRPKNLVVDASVV